MDGFKETDYKFDGKPISYKIEDNGYAINLDGKPWITQYEPYIPYKDCTYEESCLKQIEEICKPAEETVEADK